MARDFTAGITCLFSVNIAPPTFYLHLRPRQKKNCLFRLGTKCKAARSEISERAALGRRAIFDSLSWLRTGALPFHRFHILL
jgi:hypothetical protein